jgi:glycosyltransferase involved in cell wall biosynthesis
MEQQHRMMQVIDRFVLLNKASMRIMLKNGAPREKLVLNYLGHSLGDIPEGAATPTKPRQGPLRIGYIGRFADGKGVREMVAAISSLPDDIGLEFEFRGRPSGASGTEIEAQIRALADARSDVRLESPVPPLRIAQILSTFDALCVPSSSFFENGPTVVSEAHAVGIPIIGTENGAMPEIITSGVNGYLVPPGNPEALSVAFQMVAEDPQGTIDMWRSNLPHARTMSEIAEDYEALYAEITAVNTDHV